MTVYAGVDWGFEHSQVFALADEGSVVIDERVPSAPDAVARVIERLVSHAGSSADVLVGIEKATGNVVEQLLHAGLSVYNINPAKVQAARVVVSMSGAKDDRRDARVLAKLVESFREDLVCLVPQGSDMRRLRRLGRHRHALVKQRTQLQNRLSAAFREYFPAMLQVGSLDTEWHLRLVCRAPTPLDARELAVDEVQSILSASRARTRAEAVLATLDATPPTALDGVYDAMRFEIPMWAEQLLMVTKQIRLVEQQSAALLERLSTDSADGPSDVQLVLSLPGVGQRTAVVMLGEGLVDLARHNLPAARCLTGVAPVTEATGKRQSKKNPKVVMRRACNHYLRDALHNAVMAGVGNHPELQQRYRRRRARGLTPGAACRGEADRLLRILHAMLRDRTLYGQPAEPPTVRLSS